MLSVKVVAVMETYSMKFMSLEWMLLKSGKKIRPVLKIPLNSKRIETVRTYSRHNRDYTSSFNGVMKNDYDNMIFIIVNHLWDQTTV